MGRYQNAEGRVPSADSPLTRVNGLNPEQKLQLEKYLGDHYKIKPKVFKKWMTHGNRHLFEQDGSGYRTLEIIEDALNDLFPSQSFTTNDQVQVPQPLDSILNKLKNKNIDPSLVSGKYKIRKFIVLSKRYFL